MDEKDAGWIAGAVGLAAALIAWGREAFRQRSKAEARRFDMQSDMGRTMLGRIEALELREEESRKASQAREDTLRMRIDTIEEEAVEYQQAYAVLQEQHRVLSRDYKELMVETSRLHSQIEQLQSDNAKLLEQNRELHRELQELYRKIGRV